MRGESPERAAFAVSLFSGLSDRASQTATLEQPSPVVKSVLPLTWMPTISPVLAEKTPEPELPPKVLKGAAHWYEPLGSIAPTYSALPDVYLRGRPLGYPATKTSS